MKQHGAFLVAFILFMMQFGLNSCTATPISEPNPTFIITTTPTALPSATATPIKFSTQTPAPSPTPEIYTIQSNDTIIGIAKKLDLTPEAILMANPGINPSALTIGSTIQLPGDQSSTITISIPPAPLVLEQPICFTQLNLLRCIGAVTNNSDAVVENIGVDMYLISESGGEMEKLRVPILLNSLYPGESQPAIVSFELPERYNSVQAVLASAFAAEKASFSRDNSAVSSSTTISWDGMSASVFGSLTPQDGKNVWVAALGFDADGNLCAARRWEWNAASPPSSGHFTIDLVSFAGPIAKVDIIVESWSD